MQYGFVDTDHWVKSKSRVSRKDNTFEIPTLYEAFNFNSRLVSVGHQQNKEKITTITITNYK